MDTKTATPIRTDLFRFVSLRTPQLVTGEKKKARFITHPDPLKSFFLRNTDSLSLEEARDSAIAAAKSFNPEYNTLQDIKDKFDKLYPFSAWLTYNRTTLTDTETGIRITDARLLSAEEKLSVWDHLYYQTIRRNNPTVRQACIQLIIADHFVRIYSETDYKKTAIATITTPRKPFPPSENERVDLFLRRIAQSRVLINKAFSVSKTNNEGDDTSGYIKPSAGLRELNKQHKKLKTKYRVEKLNRIKNELRTGMKLVDKEKTTVAGLVEKSGKMVSADTLSFIKNSFDKHTSLSMAEGYINEMIREENRKSGATTFVRKGKRVARIPLYSYALSTDQREVLLTLNAGYMGAYLTSAKHSISFGDTTIESESVTELGSDNKQLLLIKLFADQELGDQQNKQFSFKGNFTLNNGSSIEIDTKGSANYEYTNGNAVQTANSSFTSPPSPPVILYGVHRLGIGVYRKVEQEVCCYVPGEVSRIENIMAREYKERQTRSLISTETTEEDTTEIEVENQSDTVSTNRNELQSEIAKQLSADTSISFGASVGVSGSYAGVTVSADGSFDFASSTSSTSSNSEARTYAQEVTESALEKVVQKTTQKRTSKILEEYEENNRHGFDNREGTQHVTGVYRWIDIIYKNRLINYGKRLMIEFLIPEPAKFYKQALKAKAETESGSSSSSELEAPKTLAELGINSASDITEDNYLELGRAYGVTLDEPISPAETTITKSFTPGDDPNSKADPNAEECSYSFSLNFYESGDLSMYSAYKVKASYSFDYHLGDNIFDYEEGTYFKLKVYDKNTSYDKTTTGDNKLPPTDGTSERDADTMTGTLEVTLPDIKTELPVSVQCKKRI